jgi:hypothetical protein
MMHHKDCCPLVRGNQGGDKYAGRLEAEFLLAHIRSANCTEWVVVLATLLRRKQILYGGF